jgi:hypothetical protein
MFETRKLKKFLLSFASVKKTTSLLILFCVIGGIMVPIYPANAWPSWWDAVVVGTLPVTAPLLGAIAGAKFLKSKLDEGGINIFEGMLSVGITGLVSVSSVFLSLGQGALGWVTSPGFVNVSFTGDDNTIVAEGWKIVRNLVNMFIVLGFVIVALATIIGIQEYNAQKLLPGLIAIALLINFTPVICGLMIDASNIAMNHFLSGATLNRGFIETIDYQTGAILEKEGLELTEKLGLAAGLAGFNILGGIIFMLFALLFAVRYVALWILVILSPLAFFCYIFPKAKGVWSAWWTQFFQWCIIGIPAAFFIYLSNNLTAEMMRGSMLGKPTGEISVTGFSALFMFMVPMMFMVVGLFASLKTGAMGANMITAYAQTTGKQATTRVSKWAGGKAKKQVGEIGENPWVRRRIEGAGRRAEWLDKYKHPTERGRVLADATQREKRNQEIEASKKRIIHLSADEREKVAGTNIEKIGKFRADTEQDMLSDHDKRNINVVRKYGTGKDIGDAEKKRPDWAGDLDTEKVQKIMMADSVSEEVAKKRVVRKKIEGITPLKLRQEIQPEALENVDVFTAMSKQQYEEIKNKGKKKHREAIKKNITKNIHAIRQTINEIEDTGQYERASELMDRVIEIDSSPDFA